MLRGAERSLYEVLSDNSLGNKSRGCQPVAIPIARDFRCVVDLELPESSPRLKTAYFFQMPWRWISSELQRSWMFKVSGLSCMDRSQELQLPFVGRVNYRCMLRFTTIPLMLLSCDPIECYGCRLGLHGILALF